MKVSSSEEDMKLTAKTPMSTQINRAGSLLSIGLPMSNERSHRALAQDQRKALLAHGCTAEDWGRVLVTGGFDPSRVRNAHFQGEVKIGGLTGTVSGVDGLEKPCGIYNATIADCSIGDRTRIANIGVHLAHYDIADGACIEDVATMQTRAGATFGNGVEIDVLNEAGGREVTLFDRLSSQFAYIMCLHRYRPGLIERLKAIAADYVRSVRSDRGTVGSGARIRSTAEIVDVNVGPCATVSCASRLVNGTILSSPEAPTIVGANVVAEDFIIAESSSVTDGSILAKVFVGQGCRIGRQYLAENCLFFANCEAFGGEGCSVFAGPYTVTHHKSTLLIAGLFSFCNAGSGTNQSNHMYKLGPVHEGRLLRGTKTGSLSYMMWPCRTGPFSVVLGKHTGAFDLSDFPFTHLEARTGGKCAIVPGMHLATVGMLRDGAKWPSRDRRHGPIKRDVISFDVFSPYTVGKMLKASDTLKRLHENTDRSTRTVVIGGAMVSRPILRVSLKYYRTGIEMYLSEQILARAERTLAGSCEDIGKAFAVDPGAVYSAEWLDIGGQLMPRQRLVDLEDAVESGTISTAEAFAAEVQAIDRAYTADEWSWVRNTYAQAFGVDLEMATTDDVIRIARIFLTVKTKFFNLVAADARKEFSQASRRGFGQDGADADVDEDFHQVRGRCDENEFVSGIGDSVEQLQQRVERLERRLASL